jgi:5-methyltetrahydrofolate--homocysteine methyltransferase
LTSDLSRILVMDGAMFTLTARRRITVAEAHDAYLRAGADIIKSDTFAARTAAESAAGVRAARAIAGAWTKTTPAQPRLVAGVVGIAAPADNMQGLVDGGADLLLAETLASLDEVRAVLDAHLTMPRRAGPFGPAIPLMVSVAVMPSGRLPSGEPIDAVCAVLAASPPYSAGLNCGSGTDGLRGSLETLAAALSRQALPCRISCHPSAGRPDAFGDFDEAPADTARFLRDAAEAGLIDIAGGCCGTTPEHIAAIAGAMQGLPARMART